jgi:hypothetical protein
MPVENLPITNETLDTVLQLQFVICLCILFVGYVILKDRKKPNPWDEWDNEEKI